MFSFGSTSLNVAFNLGLALKLCASTCFVCSGFGMTWRLCCSCLRYLCMGLTSRCSGLRMSLSFNLGIYLSVRYNGLRLFLFDFGLIVLLRCGLHLLSLLWLWFLLFLRLYFFLHGLNFGWFDFCLFSSLFLIGNWGLFVLNLSSRFF